MLNNKVKKILSKRKSKILERILANIKLGESHLIEVLRKKKYIQLITNISLTKNQKKDIPESLNEKSGKAALIINTILTSTLGAWLGFYDYINWEPKNHIELWLIIIFGITVSTAIGSISFHASKEENIKSVRTQKLHNIKVQLAKMILIKRKLIAKKSINTSNKILEKFYECRDWKINMKLYIDTKSTQKDFDIIKLLLYEFINQKIPYGKIMQNVESYSVKMNKRVNKKKFPDYLSLLIEAEKSTKQPSGKFIDWVLNNKKNIFVTFLPALFGVFASSFVYLSGVPNIVQKFKLFEMNYLFKDSSIKFIGLMVVIFITLYLALISTLSIYRLYKRSMHLNKSMTYFSQIENNIIQINKFNSILKKFNTEIKSVYLIKSIVEELTSCDQNQSKKSLQHLK